MRFKILALAAALPLMIGTASAATVTVYGQTGPWDVTTNAGFSYGDGNQLAATTISVTAGSGYLIQYLSGTTSSAPIDPYVDATGYTVFPPLRGNSPGKYTVAAPYLNELVGVFADASGVIVGTPFVIGATPLTVFAPTGASLLQLGISDDIYRDNSGSLQVSVTPVPEPASWLMMVGGFGMAGAALRRRAAVRVRFV